MLSIFIFFLPFETLDAFKCLIVSFEGGGGGQKGIEQYPTLSDIGGPFSLKETFVWFDFLLAALDCYTWSFGERLLSPSQVFISEYDLQLQIMAYQ